MRPYVYDLTGIDHLKAFLAVKHMPYSLLLDSADRKHPSSRYSFAMCHPIETIEAVNGKVTVTNWEQRLSFAGDPFTIVKSRLKSWRGKMMHMPSLPPFQGGAAGLFSYDLGRYVEDLPKKALKNNTVPDMAVGIYDQVLAHDYLMKQTYLFTHADSEEEAEKKRDFLIAQITNEYDTPSYQDINLAWQANFTREEYEAQIQRVIDYIYAGDIFQANLAQRFDASLPQGFDPFIHYMHMRKVNPAPFASYMNIGNVKISSASPERFITLRQGKVVTCPIKGTRPRVENVIKDRAFKNDLLSNQKDRAENTMIVDLLRNDLSKVCKPETVNVKDLCKLESFARVHHLVSTIEAELKDDKDALDLLRGAFPGGSITGAPKIRAMEIIDELEPTRRSAYCGSMGYIGFDGTMDTNILIRSLIYEDNKVSLQVGGGIVADSNPADEYQETLDKAQGVFQSFGEQHEIFDPAPLEIAG